MKSELKEMVKLSSVQEEALNGALLGDGSLIIHKNGINAYFSYLSATKSHVEFVEQYFHEWVSKSGIYDSSYIDKRTNKEYYRSSFKTYSNITFTNYYNHWYHNNVKGLPYDLKLTPLTCLIWYLGDGCICHSNRSEYIKLSTHCFKREEQEQILLPQLQQFEATLMSAGNDQYYIYIPRRKEADFLEFIGKCPFPEYQYKWEIAKYKNKQPTSHKEHEQEFCEMYKSGMTYYAIAKQFNIEPNAVKYYLKKHNLYKNI